MPVRAGDFVQAFPYDPWFYFHGEEQALAARLFTHGWDIFHMPGLPVCHLYNNADSGAPARPLHWDPAVRPQRRATGGRWSSARGPGSADLLGRSADGRLRAGQGAKLADYARFCGMDYAARTLAPVAFRGPWRPAED